MHLSDARVDIVAGGSMWRGGLHLLTPPSPLRPQRVEALIAFLSQHLRDPCAGVDETSGSVGKT